VGVFTSLKKLLSPGPKSKLAIVDVKKRFELIARTGQGSMSKVWRARDKSLGRMVCVKFLDKLKTAKFEARFIGLKRPMEGEVCYALRHPNIVQTFEYGITTDKEQYIVMELIDGMGLNFLIETRNAGLEKNRINYLLQMAEGVEFIHKQGFLHRDICPRNVMVNQEGIVKIIDFGLAVPDMPAFRRPGNRTGTPNYLAPELIKRMSTDHRVDLFALGVTAYETFTNQLPWEKTQSLQTLMSHMNSPGKNPKEFVPDLDPRIVKFLVKSIERDPRDRFQTATEFREALRTLQ
jgi:serine/threonine protein kinase